MAQTKIRQGQITTPNGWISEGETWAVLATDSPTFIFSATSASSTYSPGTRFKMTQSGADKYFICTAVSGSEVTCYGGTDYVLDSGSAITNPYYSYHKVPFGFPLEKDKWTEKIIDITGYSQVSPTAATWYNLGSYSIDVPIGSWELYFSAGVMLARAAAATMTCLCTLSTSGSAADDANFISNIRVTTTVLSGTLSQYKNISIASKTTYYLLEQSVESNPATLYLGAYYVATVIRAVCAYL